MKKTVYLNQIETNKLLKENKNFPIILIDGGIVEFLLNCAFLNIKANHFTINEVSILSSYFEIEVKKRKSFSFEKFIFSHKRPELAQFNSKIFDDIICMQRNIITPIILNDKPKNVPNKYKNLIEPYMDKIKTENMCNQYNKLLDLYINQFKIEVKNKAYLNITLNHLLEFIREVCLNKRFSIIKTGRESRFNISPMDNEDCFTAYSTQIVNKDKLHIIVGYIIKIH